ncbi:MAG TPA: ABC transporter ATP-binding protein [Solirubrobacteraceae bacterium]|nr:ABC transporter ATP-binding protein [Solirubrobacteraceae bacterium]
MLECRDVDVHYGRIHAVRGVSLSVRAGEVASIVGANGAGKTSLLRAIMGLERASAGAIEFDGADITRAHTSAIARRGLSLVPAGRQLFANLTVTQNLRLGGYTRRGGALDDVLDLFPVLRERSGQAAGTLSGGEQQMLAIGRALMAEPKLLLLDEPSLGLAPLVLDEILTSMQRLNAERGLSIVLVEQTAHLALDFAQTAFVLETGRLTASGPAAELRASERMAELYFGIAAGARS